MGVLIIALTIVGVRIFRRIKTKRKLFQHAILHLFYNDTITITEYLFPILYCIRRLFHHFRIDLPSNASWLARFQTEISQAG